jgi:uncharacterized protein (TIRG00374 family)
MKRHFIAGIMLILSALIFFFFLLPIFNVAQFIDTVKNTNLLLFVLALIVIFTSNASGAYRWSILTKEVNARKSADFSNAFGLFSIGQVAGLIVPSRIGNYTKIPMMVKLDTVPYESGLAAVNAETILDLAYICLAGIGSLLILSAFFLSNNVLSLFLLIFLIVFLIGCILFMYKIDHFRSSYERILVIGKDTNRPFWIVIPAHCMTKLFEWIQSTRIIFTEKTVVVKLISSTLLFQILGILGYFIVMESAHVSLPFLMVFAILTISFLVGIISFVPGGLGVSDLSLIILLASQGIALPVATNIALLFRIAMYLPIFLVIGGYLIQKKFNVIRT